MVMIGLCEATHNGIFFPSTRYLTLLRPGPISSSYFCSICDQVSHPCDSTYIGCKLLCDTITLLYSMWIIHASWPHFLFWLFLSDVIQDQKLNNLMISITHTVPMLLASSHSGSSSVTTSTNTSVRCFRSLFWNMISHQYDIPSESN
jgi:hypothetical protein